MKRVGIMGGTFDPVHYGHLVTAGEARWQFKLDCVLFVPNRHPPHKDPREVSIPEHRYLMTFLATATNPHFRVSRIEIDRAGPSYTIDTIRSLRREDPSAEWFYITGGDALGQILRGEWRDTERLLKLCQFIGASRPGYHVDQDQWASSHQRVRPYLANIHTMEIPAMAISSTDIRLRVREGRPITYLVPEAVEQYIATHGLYRKTAAQARRGAG